MLKNRDIVVVGQQPWDVEIGSNCKNLALEFAKNNRVLYVNSPLDRITLMRKSDDPKVQKRIDVVKKRTEPIVKIQDNLWNLYPDKMIESINWIKNEFIYSALNKYNNKRFANAILRAVEQLGFKDFILFNDNDIFRCFYFPEMLKPDVSIYYSRDNMVAVDYWKYHGVMMETQLIGKSDVCVANSVYLANYCRKYNPKSYYVGQGCELDVFTGFNNAFVPEDIAGIKKPIIGYVGALQSIRLDLDLLEYIAKEKPEWQVVLVGPEDREFIASSLHNLPNVHFLGAKSPDLLPAYINAFDVCINPQIVNEVTIGNYPRKIDEYLAMGKPTVATRTEAMSVFEEHVYLGVTKQDYITLITRALEENTPELEQARVTFAGTHTWENNAAEIYKAILSAKA